MLKMTIFKTFLNVAFTAILLVLSIANTAFSKNTPKDFNDLLKADLALVKEITFTADTSVNVVLTKKVSSFKTFTLSDPHRLVIDLRDTNFDNDNYKPVLPSFVKDFRSNVSSDNTLRLVFDLKEKLSVKSSDFVKSKTDGSGQVVTQFSKVLNGDKFATKKYYKIAKKVIVIDAGHGGKDPGTIGRYARTKEKNVTLSYAKELKKHLELTNKYKVYLTRDQDFFIPLGQRVQKARKLKADLFISLHANAIDNKNVSGFSIYTLSEKSSDKQAEKLARKENRADIIAGANFSGASSDIMKTLIDLSQRDSMNNSSNVANIIISSAKKAEVEVLQNTHRFAGFAVLTAPDMASVLIELGYLSNKDEEKKLNNLIYKRKIVKSLVEAINIYFSNKQK